MSYVFYIITTQSWRAAVISSICFLWCIYTGIAQSNTLQSLVEKKKAMQFSLEVLHDSIQWIDRQIELVRKSNFEVIQKESNNVLIFRATTSMRSGPSSYDEVIKVFDEDTPGIVLSTAGDYFRIHTIHGTGFAHKTYLVDKLLPRFTSSTPGSFQAYSTSSADYSRPNNTTSGSRSSYKSTRSTSRTYIRGPRGGCYYINSNGNKSYVDRSLCN